MHFVTFPYARVIDGFDRKKSKSKSKDTLKEEILKSSSPAPGSASASGRNSPAIGAKDDSKTEAERRFQAAQRKRVIVLLSELKLRS
jgi:protein FAM32A